MNAETAVGLSSQEEARVDRAIGALSIALCVDGALFYLLAAHELGGWHGRWTLRREVSRLRTAEDELRGALAQAEAELAVREAEWDRVEAEAQAAADEYEARQLLRLAQTAARRGPATGAYQRVKDMLDRSFSGPAGPRFMAPPAEA
jgi:hypothetical protein